MKRILAMLLAVIMLIPGYSVYADAIEEFDYIEDEVIWSCDFEDLEVGLSIHGRGSDHSRGRENRSDILAFRLPYLPY